MFEEVSSEEKVTAEDETNVEEIQPNTSNAGKSKKSVKNQPTSKDQFNKIFDKIKRQENKGNPIVLPLSDSSAAVDEYDDDSSDEEVSWLCFFFQFTCLVLLFVGLTDQQCLFCCQN